MKSAGERRPYIARSCASSCGSSRSCNISDAQSELYNRHWNCETDLEDEACDTVAGCVMSCTQNQFSLASIPPPPTLFFYYYNSQCWFISQMQRCNIFFISFKFFFCACCSLINPLRWQWHGNRSLKVIVANRKRRKNKKNRVGGRK